MNMLQFYMRPLKPAVAQLVHDLPAEGDVDLRRHLEDLLDHVVVLEEQVRAAVTFILLLLTLQCDVAVFSALLQYCCSSISSTLATLRAHISCATSCTSYKADSSNSNCSAPIALRRTVRLEAKSYVKY
jgi:hypothetical protein